MEQVVVKPPRAQQQQQPRTAQNVRAGTQQQAPQVRAAHPVQAPAMVTPTRSQEVLQGGNF